MQYSSYPDIIRRLRELGPFGDDGVASDVLHATLRALGGALSSDERESLRRGLPPELGSSLREPSQSARRRVRALFLDVALHAGIRLGLAVEYAGVVCRVLGEILTPSDRESLGHALPEIRDFLHRPSPAEAPRAPAPAASARPLQAGDTEDPSSETKLSAAAGTCG
jgi:uncharacterized protein (DUF2267 family)